MNELYTLSSLLEGRRERLHLYIYRHGLPVLDLGLETAAVDDRFGQGKPVQDDMHVARVRSRVDLIRHVIGVIPLASIGQNGIDSQRMVVSRLMAEGEQTARDDGFLPVLILAGNGIEGNCHTLSRKGIGSRTGQQTSRQARDRAADPGDVFQVFGITDLDRVAAD